MNKPGKMIGSIPVVAALWMLRGTDLSAQDVMEQRYVITDNDIYRAPNSASVFGLSGATLVSWPALSTTGWGIAGGYFGTNQQAIIKVGLRVCAFVGDPGSDDIATFDTTIFAKPVRVGNYDDPSGSGAYTGIALAARGTTLLCRLFGFREYWRMERSMPIVRSL